MSQAVKASFRWILPLRSLKHLRILAWLSVPAFINALPYLLTENYVKAGVKCAIGRHASNRYLEVITDLPAIAESDQIFKGRKPRFTVNLVWFEIRIERWDRSAHKDMPKDNKVHANSIGDWVGLQISFSSLTCQTWDEDNFGTNFEQYSLPRWMAWTKSQSYQMIKGES